METLKQIVEDLKTNLDIYFKDVKEDEGLNGNTTTLLPLDLSTNEWALQIACIYKAAYGEELDLTNISLE